MSNVLIDDTYLTNIADSIRSKLHVSTKFKPSEMANGIASISGGIGKRFTDIQTTHVVSAEITADDFVQGETIKAEAFHQDAVNKDILYNYEQDVESIIFPRTGVISTPTSLTNLFLYNRSIKYVYFNGLITSTVTRLDQLFYGCTNLINVDFGQSDTSNVTNISAMFYGCTSLEHVDLSTLDFTKVTTTTYLFHGCTNLISVIFPSTITNLYGYGSGEYRVFYNCPSLQSLTILATTPPTLNGTYLLGGNGTWNEGMKIFVPATSVEAYKTANNQSVYADIIYAIP